LLSLAQQLEGTGAAMKTRFSRKLHVAFGAMLTIMLALDSKIDDYKQDWSQVDDPV
jgi:hypothetical protein